MTTERDATRAVRDWLEDGVTVLPDRVADAVLADLHGIRQQRGRLGWIRRPVGGLRVATFAGAAAVLLVAVVMVGAGLRFGGGPGPAGTLLEPTPGPSPTVAPTPTPTPTPAVPPAPGYGTAPPNWPVNPPYAPASPLPSPAGSPLPADLVGRLYDVDPPATQDTQALVLTLRAADDPHCTAMYQGRSTCFTILWTPNYPLHVSDPGVRGAARIDDQGHLVLGFALVPNDPSCEGTESTYTIVPGADRLQGVDFPGCSFGAFTKH